MSKFLRILGIVLTHLLLFVASVVVGWGLAYTIMEGFWWVVPTLAVVLAFPTAVFMVWIEKRRQYTKASRVVIDKYKRRGRHAAN